MIICCSSNDDADDREIERRIEKRTDGSLMLPRCGAKSKYLLTAVEWSTLPKDYLMQQS